MNKEHLQALLGTGAKLEEKLTGKIVFSVWYESHRIRYLFDDLITQGVCSYGSILQVFNVKK